MNRPPLACDWHESHDNLCAMAHHLLDSHDFDARQLLYFFEKPWKWDAEWREYQLGLEKSRRGDREKDVRRGMV